MRGAASHYLATALRRCISRRASASVGLLALLLGVTPPVLADQQMRRTMPGAMNSPAQAVAPNVAALIKPPYKPIELSVAGAGAQQSSVRWKVPDQTDGRAIAQWLVRACPKVDGNPYAACQQVQQLNGPGGQSSGTYVQVQVPTHVTFMGADTPVNGAEICSVNPAGTSCADRVTVVARSSASAQAVPPGVVGGAAGARAPAGVGFRAAPGSQAALNPQPLPPGGTPSTARGIPPEPVGGFGARHLQATDQQTNMQLGQGRGAVGPVAPQSPQRAMSAADPSSSTRGAARSALLPSGISARSPSPVAVTAAALRISVTAPSPVQDIVVNAASLSLKVATASPLPGIDISAAPLRLAVKEGAVKAMAVRGLPGDSVAITAAPLRISVAEAAPVKPIAIDASALTLKASAIPVPPPISFDAPSLKLIVTQP